MVMDWSVASMFNAGATEKQFSWTDGATVPK